MRHVEFFERWTVRREAYELAEMRGVVAVIDHLLADVAEMMRADAEEVVTPTEAARAGGYSADHIARLIRRGAIENVGRPGAPRLRRRDVPQKPGRRLPAPVLGAKLGGAKRQIAVSIASTRGRTHGH